VKVSALIIASATFAFFVLCPRMVGMASVISGIKDVNPWLAVVIGAVLAIPLMILMYWVLQKYGAAYAIGLAVATDLVAAVIIGTYSWKATVSVLIIAIFVWAGIFVANLVGKAIA
jgi:uncharacterized membrane protein YdcZ (DUF606 family)